MVQHASGMIGGPATWPQDPDKALAVLDQAIQRTLLETDAKARKRIGFIFQHAQYLIPAGDLSMLARGQAARLVRFLSWAQNPYIKRVNMAFCLVADRLSEVNDRLVQNPHVAAIQIPLPDSQARRSFVQRQTGSEAADRLGGLSPEGVAELSSGLNLVDLNFALLRAGGDGKRLSPERFRLLKKTLIERRCQGLVTFVEPEHSLDMVVGHQAAKDRLRQDAEWIGSGQLDTAPMGYLICGPVGTGKTFLAECYAGSIGIPCVTLRNFRSKYVGETEGNLEQVLTVLRSLGPVVVIVDEADAALGSREMEGDSGTSGRVFSMVAQQMGDTRYRGRIVWMLLTSRPDLLPIDLKRQGRAEVHIPLFYPENQEELAAMFRIMADKNDIQLANNEVPEVSGRRKLSGADVESIVLSAKRRVLAAGRTAVELSDLQSAVDSFIPSAQGLEKEMQELAAVLECTDREFLPDDWRRHIDAPEGPGQLRKRLVALKELVES
jgi:AAA+ superfamily predicted ATPase